MFDQVVTRRAEEVVRDLLLDEPVVALHGPRSVGKSTLLRRVADEHGVGVVDLDAPIERDAAGANPMLTVAGPRPVCVDEYQRVPVLLDALKARLNSQGAIPGTAILTGSTRHDALPMTAQALTGRFHSLVLWPLSQGEIANVHENLLEYLFEAPSDAVAAHPRSETERAQYVERLVVGGFPIAMTWSSERSRSRWFDNYVRQSTERDAAQLSRLRQRHLLAEALARLAGRTGQVLNIANLAQDLKASWDTVESLIRLLEDLFLVARLPAWGKTLTSRATGSPKIHIVDSGLAARLMRVSPTKLAAGDAATLTEFGHLVETFVVGELRKQASWLDVPVTLGHWRTADVAEVDLIIEHDDGRVLAFEAKAAERVSSRDFSGLTTLRERLGNRFVAGVALTMGPRSYTYADRLHVMPIDRLWTPI